MKRTRHTPEQVINKLREADAMLSSGRSVAQVLQHLGVSEQTFHRCRNQYGGMKSEAAKRLTELEVENARLKRLFAENKLAFSSLKEANEFRTAAVGPAATALDRDGCRLEIGKSRPYAAAPAANPKEPLGASAAACLDRPRQARGMRRNGGSTTLGLVAAVSAWGDVGG